MTSPAVGSALLQFQEWCLGRPSFAVWKSLEGPALTPGQMQAARAARLQELFDHARRHIPGWRARLQQAPLRVDPVCPVRALDAVPVLTRTDFVRERESLWWRDTPHKVLKHVSGGSTDDNLEFYHGRERQAWNRAIRWRALSRLGIQPGDPVLHLWPHFPPDTPLEALKDRVRSFRNLVTNDREFDPRPFGDQTCRQALRQLTRQPGTLLFCFPSWAMELLRYCQATGQAPAGLRSICCSGEVLYPTQRAALTQAWGVPVFEEYGSQETGAIANDDHAGVFQLNAEHVLVEVLRNGKPAAPGELGEVVVTNLTSTLMPFVRYATGDVIRQPEPGTPHWPGELGPVCPRVEGRTSDLLLTGDGQLVTSRPLVEDLLPLFQGRPFHIRQQSPQACELHLLEPCAPHADQGAEQIRQHLGRTTQVTVVVGRAFAPLRSGKHRFVCSRDAARQIAHDRQASDDLARIWAQPVVGGLPLAGGTPGNPQGPTTGPNPPTGTPLAPGESSR
ncbi:MAG: phenylacetate--CoA ligase family protein [Planctomycetaceae bacterium]